MPTVRVVEAEEMTEYTGGDDSPEMDALIAQAVAAAVDKVESLTSRALITREITETRPYCDWLRKIQLLRGPVVSIDSVTADGEALDTDKYELINDCVYFDPYHLCTRKVVIVYTAGYGTEAGDVPDALRLAVKRIAATALEHREDVVVGTIATTLPHEVTGLISQYRRLLI
jgi:uncharacterized phiE125 gp8 family phage protein